MSRLSLIAVLVALLALSLSAMPAAAQEATPTPTISGQFPGGSEEEDPATEEEATTEEDGGSGSRSGTGSDADSEALANTGAEPLVIALLGLGLLASGFGLRLSLAPGGRLGF
jgi:hypothetical protein